MKSITKQNILSILVLMLILLRTPSCPNHTSVAQDLGYDRLQGGARSGGCQRRSRRRLLLPARLHQLPVSAAAAAAAANPDLLEDVRAEPVALAVWHPSAAGFPVGGGQRTAVGVELRAPRHAVCLSLVGCDRFLQVDLNIAREGVLIDHAHLASLDHRGPRVPTAVSDPCTQHSRAFRGSRPGSSTYIAPRSTTDHHHNHHELEQKQQNKNTATLPA